MGNILYYLLAVSFLGIAYSFWKFHLVKKAGPEKGNLSEYGEILKKGALHYIQNGYKVLLLFSISVGLLLYFKNNATNGTHWFIVVSYLIGAGIAAISAFFGIKISTLSNSIVANESRSSFLKGFQAANTGSAAIALANISLLMFGLLSLMISFQFTGNELNTLTMLNELAGFVLGASTVSLFTRFAGSLFGKSAEIADDQIQHSEPGILSNSLYNPASSVVDMSRNITHVGGIGAEITGSFAAILIATMILSLGFAGSSEIALHLQMGPMLVPLAIGTAGILASISGLFILKASSSSNAEKMTSYAEILSAGILLIASYFIIHLLLPAEWNTSSQTPNEVHTTSYFSLGVFWCALIGIVASVAIGKTSDLFLDKKSKSIQFTANESIGGIDSNILGGFQNGFRELAPPVAIMIFVAVLSNYFAGLYGIGIASAVMLSNMGFYQTLCAFAPVAANSNTIALKESLDSETVQQTENLNYSGIANLSKYKVFEGISSAFTAIALLFAFITIGNGGKITISEPVVITGLLLGALIPFLIGSSGLASIRKISKKMTNEVRRQFAEIPELTEAKEILDKYNGDLTYATAGEKETVYSSIDEVDHQQLVEVSTYPSVWGALLPGIMVIGLTSVLGYFAGTEILTGFLTGIVISSILLSIFLTNTGNSLESTKTAFETGIEIDGEIHGKTSPAYQNSIIGFKTVKPMSDAIAPAILLIMKMALITAIIIGSSLG